LPLVLIVSGRQDSVTYFVNVSKADEVRFAFSTSAVSVRYY